jgi:cyclophilin family peptidyl-prolyl cis-trans isomerase/protein-disulfide isomerase
MMKKIFLPFLLLAWFASACTGGSQTTPTLTATALPEAYSPKTSAPTQIPQATALPTSQPTADIAAGEGCTVVSPQPTPGPTEQSLFPPVSAQDWVRGPAAAPVTVMIYSDFQCPYCAQLETVLAQLQAENPQGVRVVFRQFPLIGTPEQPFHDKAALAAQAVEAAGMQDKFWEMHDLLFEKQSEWAAMTASQFQEWLLARAAELGLEADQFSQDLISQLVVDKIQAAWDYGNQIGLPGTPFVLIDGHIWPSNVPMDFSTMDAVVKLTLLESRQFSACPTMTIDPLKQYAATLVTEKGNIVLELFADRAPLAVNNFLFLARNGWYDGVTFHRVLPDFVAQAGDPTGTGYGGPGYAFVNEISPDLTFDREGLVAMANAGPDSNGSQFFITYAPAPNLDGSYTIFGQVIQGMDVVKKLTPRNPQESGDLPPGDQIIRIEIQEK